LLCCEEALSEAAVWLGTCSAKYIGLQRRRL